MIGRQGGVGRELSKLLDRDLVITHCAAHRLELVVKKSFKQSVPEQDKFTLDVNSFGVFYGAMNTKKWQHLIGKSHGIMNKVDSSRNRGTGGFETLFVEPKPK